MLPSRCSFDKYQLEREAITKFFLDLQEAHIDWQPWFSVWKRGCLLLNTAVRAESHRERHMYACIASPGFVVLLT